MKWLVLVLGSLWLICGITGAWWLDDLNSDHWDVIAKGPISLAKAYNDNPPNYPGPN